MATAIKKKIYLVLLIFVVGGISGWIWQRFLFPFVLRLPGFKNIDLIAPSAPIIITRREEIRINEGVNRAETARSVRDSLARIYLDSGEETGGLVASSDGIIVIPGDLVRPGTKYIVVLGDGRVFHEVKVFGVGRLTATGFLKINAVDLPVIKQGQARDLASGEKVLAVWTASLAGETSIWQATITKRALVEPSLARVYQFDQLNTEVFTDLDFTQVLPGATVINKDGLLVGLVTGEGMARFVLRAEELKQTLANVLDDQKITWPAISKLEYFVFGEIQSKVAEQARANGILVKTAVEPLRANDFIYSVDGQEFGPKMGFQELVLAKKPGETLKLKLLRVGKEVELEFTL